MRALRRAVIVVGVLTVVVVIGIVSWNRSWRRAGPANPGVACPAIVRASDRVPFAASGVHRVALIGDSIMVQASCSIANSLRDLGIETSRHAVSGSGLLTGAVDWVAETERIMRTERPDVVVAIFVGNYPAPPVRFSSGVIGADTPAFYRAWQQRAERVSSAVNAAGARMYWVSPPPIELAVIDRSVRVFRGYRDIRGDHLLHTGSVLAGSDGGELQSKQTCGRRRNVRAPDAVHLTDDGARIYGQQIAHDLSADWGILTAPQPC